MGGLGHMGVKLAAAMGAEVTVLSQTLTKQEDGLRFGAKHYYATSERETFKDLASSFDLILNTVSANLDLDAYLDLLRVDGTLVSVGAPRSPTVPVGLLADRGGAAWPDQRSAGMPETQEMLDFCAEHGRRARDRADRRRRGRRGLRARRAQRRPLPLRDRHRHAPPRNALVRPGYEM